MFRQNTFIVLIRKCLLCTPYFTARPQTPFYVRLLKIIWLSCFVGSSLSWKLEAIYVCSNVCPSLERRNMFLYLLAVQFTAICFFFLSVIVYLKHQFEVKMRMENARRMLFLSNFSKRWITVHLCRVNEANLE